MDKNTDNVVIFVFCLSMFLDCCSDLSRSRRIDSLEKEVAELKMVTCP
jgi:hypothetical protein